LRQRITVLEQQIATALQQRQSLLKRFQAVRDIRMSPAFGQQRRRVDDAGRELAGIEKQLDMLYAELQQVQTTLLEREQAQRLGESSSLPGAPGSVDAQGHDQAYWQQRVVALRVRLQHARAQRQEVLAQFDPVEGTERSGFGRRGHEVLQLVQTLEQTWQELRMTEAALQALHQEASRSGAPLAWLR
jgi:hypothetical protein